MGFNWNYNLHVSPEFVRAIDNLQRIVKIFKQNGFALRSSSDAKIRIVSEGEFYEHESELDCLNFILQHGGMLQFWKTSTLEVGLAVMPEDYMREESEISELAELAIYVDNTYYRNHDADSKALATVIETIFGDLATLSSAEYGYVDNDNSDLEIDPDIGKPLIYGVTLLSEETLRKKPLETIQSFIHHSKAVNNGQLIFLTEYPWEIDESQVIEANKVW